MANEIGGWSVTKDATEETQKICDKVKSQVEEKTDKKYVDFIAVKYRELFRFTIGIGTYYLIKVHVGGVNYIHLYVFKEESARPFQVFGVQQHKTKDDPLEPFNN